MSHAAPALLRVTRIRVTRRAGCSKSEKFRVSFKSHEGWGLSGPMPKQPAPASTSAQQARLAKSRQHHRSRSGGWAGGARRPKPIPACRGWGYNARLMPRSDEAIRPMTLDNMRSIGVPG
jgi:hypothetical protein